MVLVMAVCIIEISDLSGFCPFFFGEKLFEKFQGGGLRYILIATIGAFDETAVGDRAASACRVSLFLCIFHSAKRTFDHGYLPNLDKPKPNRMLSRDFIYLGFGLPKLASKIYLIIFHKAV